MKPAGSLLSSLDRTWDDFSDAWKKARSKSSEKAVHDLRVSTRRLMATLELADNLSHRSQIRKVQRHLKKVLKSMGPLRDIQVQIKSVSDMEQRGLIDDFKRSLKRREKRKIARVPSELTRDRKQSLAEELKDARSKFRSYESLNENRIRRAVERVLNLRRNEFLKAEKRFHRIEPRQPETLHEMRIALKKLRYVVEAAQPVLGPSAKERSREMRAFQQLMGDTRDLEMLRSEMEKWAKKRGKQIAIVPALDQLQEKREALIKKIVESSNQLGQLLQNNGTRPIAEKTHAVAASVPTPGSVLIQ